MIGSRHWVACASAFAAMTAAAAAPGPQVQWTDEPAVVAPGTISTQFREVRATVSPDGRLMLWGSSDRPGSAGSYDIWMSRAAASGWGPPEPVPFNTKYKEFDPAFSPDGRWLYFFSDRPGGLGGDDIYRVAMTESTFGTVEHLDAAINSSANEWAPVLSPDGRTLMFASNGRGGQGRHDLFVAQFTDGHWSQAQPVPGGINSPGDEFDATFLGDGTSIVYSYSENLETEPVTLKMASRGAAGYERPTSLPFAAKFLYAYGPEIDWHDRSVLLFTGVPTGSKAKADIYRIRYRIAGE
jgi:Tol biopolymer transport system component